MKKQPPKNTSSLLSTADRREESAFNEVLAMIEAAHAKASLAANSALVELYWQIGEYISRKLDSAAWGEGIVDNLACYIHLRHPTMRGFTRRNLFRMRQFFETYPDRAIVTALLTQLPWTHHLMIISRCKRADERVLFAVGSTTAVVEPRS